MNNESKLVALPYKMTNMDSLSETYREKPGSQVWISQVSKIIARGEEELSVGYLGSVT